MIQKLLTLGIVISSLVLCILLRYDNANDLNIYENKTILAHEHSTLKTEEEMFHSHHSPTPFRVPTSPKTPTRCIQETGIQTIVNEEGKHKKNGYLYTEELHLHNLRQLTFGGENAEAYFNFKDNMLVYQAANKKHGLACDQIFIAKIPESQDEPFSSKMISTGRGRTTCSYFLPGDNAILYASTHQALRSCPPEPDRKKIKKYVWPLYPSFEIYYGDFTGSVTRQLTKNDYYDAEATVSPNGNKVVFTSTRSGDIELYVMDIDGENLKQVTFGLGYDGGAFFSPDSKKLVFRASRPKTPEAIKEYKDLLAKDLVAPTNMELYVCNIDGSDLQQVTDLGNANWAPYFHPSGEKILFSSNHKSKRGFPFNIFMINMDGTGLEQITFDETFDSFPMFSYDGKKLVFASNRNNGGTRDTNLFIADWID